jgi:hypothetical protein
MSDKTAIELYESLSKPPTTALKKIEGGRLKNLTDIKPQWRTEIMTKEFGLCGIGWKYTIDKLWTEKGAGDEIMAFAQISLYIKQQDIWSEAIPGLGGSMLIAKESNGPHSSDEAYKMAVTDALGKAMTYIGVAASIYMGEWTGSKYRDTENTNEKSAGERAIEKEFGVDPEPENNEQFVLGQDVPKAYWSLSTEEKKKYMPHGLMAEKQSDGVWRVVKYYKKEQ